MYSENRNMSVCQFFYQDDLPETWDCVPLEHRIELLYGVGLREGDRQPGEIPVYGSNGIFGTHSDRLVEGPGILVGRKGSIGAVHYSVTDYWPIDTVYYINTIKDDNLRYIYHLLNYLPLSFLNAATGVPGLSRRDVYALRGAFPPLIEQVAIAHILDAVDNAIERTRDGIARAQDLRQSVIQQFFYDALGSTAYADRPKKKLPNGWSLIPMDTLLDGEPKNGVSPNANSQPPGVPTFSIAAIRHGRVNLETEENLKYVQLDEAIAGRYRINKGDILIVRGNANPDLVGKAGMVDQFPANTIYPDIAKRVRFRTEGETIVLPNFAVLVWNHSIVHNQILRRAKTSNGTLKINNRDVKQIILPVPGYKEQIAIVEQISATERYIGALSKVVHAQERLKKSLMHDLLSGRVRVGRV